MLEKIGDVFFWLAFIAVIIAMVSVAAVRVHEHNNASDYRWRTIQVNERTEK